LPGYSPERATETEIATEANPAMARSRGPDDGPQSEDPVEACMTAIRAARAAGKHAMAKALVAALMAELEADGKPTAPVLEMVKRSK
jgi:hypothetical protein